MLIGVPAESMAGENRVAATPETVKKLKAQGHTLQVQSGAGIAASVTDAAYEAAGAQVVAWGKSGNRHRCQPGCGPSPRGGGAGRCSSRVRCRRNRDRGFA